MSVEEANKIDIIATRPDSNIVRLVISDHLNWSNFREHALLIQEKVNRYIGFVESGQLLRLHQPQIPEHPAVMIVLALQQEPSHEGEDFLRQVSGFLASAGIQFEVDRRYIVS